MGIFCKNCNKEFDEPIENKSIKSWFVRLHILKCPECKQLYASGLLPIEVREDSSIIINERTMDGGGELLSKEYLKHSKAGY